MPLLQCVTGIKVEKEVWPAQSEVISQSTWRPASRTPYRDPKWLSFFFFLLWQILKRKKKCFPKEDFSRENSCEGLSPQCLAPLCGPQGETHHCGSSVWRCSLHGSRQTVGRASLCSPASFTFHFSPPHSLVEGAAHIQGACPPAPVIPVTVVNHLWRRLTLCFPKLDNSHSAQVDS